MGKAGVVCLYPQTGEIYALPLMFAARCPHMLVSMSEIDPRTDAPPVPIRLRIGVHTGEVQLRDEGNYIGPTINRTARLRDLAHGGQTVLSGATEPLVVDQLPPDVTLTVLGAHPLRDLPRPERVVQLCHPDLHNE